MRDIINGLKEVQVLREQDIFKLKTYIHTKHPAASEQKKAAILADALHRIIDRNLAVFDHDNVVTIRKSVLQSAVVNNRYNIHGDDIFRSCLLVGVGTDDYVDSLTQWVNLQQDSPVSREIIQRITVMAKGVEKELLDRGFEFLFESLEPPVERVEQPLPVQKQPKQNLYRLLFVAASAVAFIAGPMLWKAVLPLPLEASTPVNTPVVSTQSSLLIETKPALPSNLTYKKVNEKNLRSYLAKKNSLLAEEPYFSSILTAAQDFNVNPLLLFAITGHEQAFVPKSHKQAKKMANNPFNVFNSWQSYNTNITDSARIAARTLVNASSNRPENVDPLKWINRKYAEDPNWWVGVSSLLRDLEKATEK